MVRNNRGSILETLSGGILALEGLLNIAVLREVLSDEFAKHQFHVGELIRYFDLEIWLRQLLGDQAQRVAA
jgi:hypothetical protein